MGQATRAQGGALGPTDGRSAFSRVFQSNDEIWRRPLARNRERREHMSSAARRLARPDAAERIADRVEELEKGLLEDFFRDVIRH